MTLALITIAVGDGDPVPAQFNPASLRITTSNQFDDGSPNQVSKPTSFKLDAELLFDTTETGTDVHRITRAIRYAAIATGEGATPAASGSQSQSADPTAHNSHLELVVLTWGTHIYQGYVESLNETLDYFSSDGVPLRSTLQISLKGTTSGFLTGRYSDIQNFTDNPVPALPKVVMTSAAIDKDRVTKVTGGAGDKTTGRGTAALNGIENIRGGAGAGFGASAGAGFAAGGALAVGGSAQLKAAAGFKLSGGVSAGASVGFGIGASAGLSAGAGLGASVGVGLSAGAGIGGGIGIGASGGIGIGASAGAGIAAGISGGIGISGSASGGIGISASTSVTGFNGVTTTSTSASFTGLDGITRSSSSTTQSSAGGFGSASAGISASAGAFAGLGASRTSMPGAGFNPDRLLPPPLPATGAQARYDVSGRVVSDNGQVAASYSARAGVAVW